MIGIICGSARSHSNTYKVALAIKKYCLNKGIQEKDISIPDFTIFDLPFHNQDNVNKESLSAFQNSVYTCMRDSNLIFMLSPEYNWFPSAEIITLINQFGSKDFLDCWQSKVFATCGVSSGRGGRIPAIQLTYVLNKIINVLDLHSVVSPKVFESQFTGKSLGKNGESLGNEEYDKGLEKFVHFNLDMVNKILPGLQS